MAYVKKLVMQGFKSFANRTEVPFDRGINAIIGPNGSGKSNVTDALCFVLGRLSAKSMRAAKASNLLFQGSKERKPSHEASVEIIFDNSDHVFNHEAQEIIIKRSVRRNGLSIYKLNNETKTRQEIIELLAHAGVDPNGYNIVLQGEIAKLIKMRPEERREIIEEVAGISIYEARKLKSMSEIEKTEGKLKEVGSVLRERTAYLKNLESERKQALKFKELEQTVKGCKATLIKKNIEEKEKEISELNKNIEKDKKYKDSIKKQIELANEEITQLDARINEINQYIQKTTGFERETLNEEITDLNVKIASESARKENFEKRLSENLVRKEQLEKNISELDAELSELKQKSPHESRKIQDIKKKKDELEMVTDQRNKINSLINELNSINHRIKDKEKQSSKISFESKILLNQIKAISQELSSDTLEECESEINKIKSHIEEYEKEISDTNAKKMEIEKLLSVSEDDKKKNIHLKERMPKSDTCPLCQTKLSSNHVAHVVSIADQRIEKASHKIDEYQRSLISLNQKLSINMQSISDLKKKLSQKQLELIKLNNIEEKKTSLKRMVEDENSLKKEITQLEDQSKNLSSKISQRDLIEEKYEKLLFEIQEISSRTTQNIDTSLLYKEREIESTRNVIKNILRDHQQIEQEIKVISQELKENKQKLSQKEKSSKELSDKFNKLFEERTAIQEKIKNKNILLINHQNGLSRIDDAINNIKITIAGISASKESFEYELREFEGVNIISGSKQSIEERLDKSQKLLSEIGSVNLRALETYDAIKEEYDKIAQKAEQLEKERDEILKVIQEIDIKKKRTFMKTFTAINELFSRNFSQLSVKGTAFLEIENKEDVFAGGVNITIKVGKGKYFDVTSLSGGEQTLVALSLIFAIQEYKPFFFYILDEIDAALDKRNSELLANLLKKYIRTGQYIIISHNDSIISGADVLYGVSMNNGVSKVLSLEIRDIPVNSPQNPSEEQVQSQEIKDQIKENINDNFNEEIKENIKENFNEEINEEINANINDNFNIEKNEENNPASVDN